MTQELPETILVKSRKFKPHIFNCLALKAKVQRVKGKINTKNYRING